MTEDRSPHFILSPYFLDEADSKLRDLHRDDWTLVETEASGHNTQQRISSLLAPLSEAVCATRQKGRVPVAVVGDCCATIGVLAGLQRAGVDPTLLWFDAHGDFNTWETSPSGFLGGMPLAMMTGRGEQTMVDAVGLNTVDDEKIVLAGARDLDLEERGLLEASRVNMVADVEMLLTTPLPHGPLYVHFDTDIIRAEEVPAQRYPVRGGPSSRTMGDVFRRIASSGRVAGVSMTTWHPDTDLDGSAREICMSTLDTLVGAQ